MRAPYSWRTRLWGLACTHSGQHLLPSDLACASQPQCLCMSACLHQRGAESLCCGLLRGLMLYGHPTCCLQHAPKH